MLEPTMISRMIGIQNEHDYTNDPWYEELLKEFEENKEREKTKHYREDDRKKLGIYEEDNNPQTPVIDPYQKD